MYKKKRIPQSSLTRDMDNQNSSANDPTQSHQKDRVHKSVQRMTEIRRTLKNMQVQSKKNKAEFNEIEQFAINMLMHWGIRYVDTSGCGRGPFWVICKEKTDGAFNMQRYTEFFTYLINKLKTDQLNPEQCGDLAIAYLKQFEKRRLVLKEVKQCRQRGVADLKKWLEGEPGYANNQKRGTLPPN